MSTINKKILKKAYLSEKKSVRQIATEIGCSENKINYWLAKHGIPKRSISDAIYLKNNPNGDPFCEIIPNLPEEWFLLGLGLGLFWGEGNKRDPYSVRLGNTDPALVRTFVIFLERMYGLKRQDMRFGLQIFSDMRPTSALRFWCKYLKTDKKQFYKVIITPARSIGTYKNKTKHGVLTVYYSNKKLRNLINEKIEKMSTMY